MNSWSCELDGRRPIVRLLWPQSHLADGKVVVRFWEVHGQPAAVQLDTGGWLEVAAIYLRGLRIPAHHNSTLACYGRICLEV
jgi:hypothetical protein